MFSARYEGDCYTISFFWERGGFQKSFKDLDTQFKYKCAILVSNFADSSKVFPIVPINYVSFLPPKLTLYYNKNSLASRDRAVGTAATRQTERCSVRILVGPIDFPPQPKLPYRLCGTHISCYCMCTCFFHEGKEVGA